MTTRYKVTTEPTSEPVTASEVKLDLRITSADDDALIAFYISAARRYVERYTGKRLMPTLITEYFENWPSDCLVLTTGPLASVTSVAYIPDGGTSASYTTVDAANYEAISSQLHGVIYFRSTFSKPSVLAHPHAIKIVYIAGYADASAVPEDLKRAVRYLAALSYEHRCPVIEGNLSQVPHTLDAILNSHAINFL